MNKFNILFLGALIAMGMVACDDKLPVAPPQANEQGPVLEGFEGAYANLLVTNIDLPTIDLGAEEGEDADQGEGDAEAQVMPLAELDDVLTLYTVDAGTSGLPQEDVWGQLEISNTADFAESIVLEPVDGIVGTVNLADLQEAHVQLFGVSPEAKTVYYRIPLYVNLDGSTYRLNALDSYGATGTYAETYDPGFTMESTYYIIGIDDNWNPGEVIEMSHAEGVSVYDDPTFTYEFESEKTTYWKIVPPDVQAQVGNAGFDAGTDYWPFLYYAIPSEDDNLQGTLKQGDEPTGSIPAGEWTITINMKDFTYSVSGTPAVSAGDPAGIYLRGIADVWNELQPQYQFLATIEEGVYIIPFTTIPATTFKVADANWNPINLGVPEGGKITPNTAIDLISGDESQNITLEAEFTGAVILAKEESGYTLLLQTYETATAGAESGIYIRGELNNWGNDGLTVADEFKTTAYKDVCELTGVSIEADKGFKIADQNWGPINLGGPGSIDIAATPSIGLALNSQDNLSLKEAFSGNLRLIYILDSYFLQFVPASK